MKSGNKNFNSIMYHTHANINFYTIYFDEWFINKDYRIKITNDLKLNFNDKGLNDVYSNGRSSFDEFRYDGKAQKMDVLNRWKKYKGMTYIDPNLERVWKQNYPEKVENQTPQIIERKNRWW